MNIVIPIGGVGQRFKDQGYLMPKPLISVLGKPMIYRVIDSLDIDKNDTIHIVYNNQLKQFNFEELLKHYFPAKNILFYCLEYNTKGAAETVLACLNCLSNDQLKDSFLLLDCDTFYEHNIIKEFKESNFKNLIHYFKTTDPNPIFSYIKTDENNKVIEIKEKVKISDNANSGAYGFENGNQLKKYCDKILNLKGELYISRVYEELIDEGIEVYGKEISNFNCVGTPLQLQIYCNKNKHKSEKLRVCFDLDNTLVTYPDISGNYDTVKPIDRNIKFARLLKDLGHTIIIYTARRMKTHKGNVGAVISDIAKVTFDTLDRYDIPYDEIYFGKPYADFYIDDLSVNPSISLDKSMGIFNTDIEARDFNKVEFFGDKVIKHTANPGEVFWYKNIPQSVSNYFPKIINIKNKEIELERINGINYSYLYVNKQLTKNHIDKLIHALASINASKYPEDINIYSNYSEKINNRLLENNQLYIKYNIVDLVFKIINLLKEYENKKEGLIGVIHGDPVFTNIFETPTGIKFIDMRGKQGNKLTIFGDINYDLAKIYQSLIGYDNILNGIEIDDEYRNSLISYFENKINKKSLNNIKLITSSLLISMLPLHSDDEIKFSKYIKLINNLIK